MSMKYIKLFESWRLMEAGKQDAFDVNNPNGFPVLQTTIGDLRKAIKSGKGNDAFLSVLRRSAQTEKVWNPDAGKDVIDSVLYTKEKIVRKANPYAIVKSAMARLDPPLDYKDEGKMQKLAKDLGKHIADQKLVDIKGEYNDKEYESAMKKYKNYIDKLLKMDSAKRVETLGIDSKYTKPILNQFIAHMEERLTTLKESDPIPTVRIEGKDESFYLDLDLNGIDDTSLNPDDAPITDLVFTECDDVRVAGERINIAVEENKLTLGMIATWINNFARTGSSKDSLLSSTGFKNYKDNIASIFSGEEAEALTEFAVTLKIGGQSVDLSNDASGNSVPFFAGDEMFGVCKFDFDSAKLQDSGKDTLKLDKLWKKLANAEKTLEIVGHTDSTGKADYNQKLSEARANAVLKFMQSLPQAKTLKVKMTASGKGSTKPAKDDKGGKDKKMAALNRRVEILIDGVGFDYTKL